MYPVRPSVCARFGFSKKKELDGDSLFLAPSIYMKKKYNCCIDGCENCCCDCKYCGERIYYSTTKPYCFYYRRYIFDIDIANCKHYSSCTDFLFC